MSQQSLDATQVSLHNEQSTQNANDLELYCLIEGQSHLRTFEVQIPPTKDVMDLRDVIYAKGFREPGFPSQDLTLCKVIDPTVCAEDLEKLRYTRDDGVFRELLPVESVSFYWPSQPEPREIDVFVKSPAPGDADSHRVAKRQKLDPLAEDKLLQTPPTKERAKSDADYRSTYEQTTDAINKAFKPFTRYIESLAAGELDPYLDSYDSADKLELDGLRLPRKPLLLLHNLGRNLDEKRMSRIGKLFQGCPVHFFALSGSGKTRLTLDGLCEHWGLYLPCLDEWRPGPGPRDFFHAPNIILGMGAWNLPGTSEAVQVYRARLADRVFAMMTYSRIFILHQLIQHIPEDASAWDTRRRWVLAQVLPPMVNQNDLFIILLKALRKADTDMLIGMIDDMVDDIARLRPNFFPKRDEICFSVVIDEVQVAAKTMSDHFLSAGGETRPLLREMYRFFFGQVRLVSGIILTGTGFTRKMVDDVVDSVATKQLRRPNGQIFTDVGRFTRNDREQENYILRYLGPCADKPELVERMKYWLSGRYRFTASFIELLLCSKTNSCHRMLTAFVKHLTGFEITDAVELEEAELPLDEKSLALIQSYGTLLPPGRLFGPENMHWLAELLMRWTVGCESTTIPLDGDVQGMIECGIGFLDGPEDTEGNSVHVPKPQGSEDDEFKDRSVHVSEPLIVLALSSRFEKRDYTKRYSWLQKSFNAAPTKLARGTVFESAVLSMLIDRFGGKPTALGKVFCLTGDLKELASTKVTLVALKCHRSGSLSCSPVTWTSGCSDRFGTKARDPKDILDFLANPDGKAFLFLDDNMGPDLLCILREEKTGDLIISVVQAKFQQGPTLQQVETAALTTEPEYYYIQSRGTANAKQYAQVKYPELLNDLKRVLGELGGSQISGLEATPRFLKVICIPDDHPQLRSDDIGFLKWDVMFNYLGPSVDILLESK